MALKNGAEKAGHRDLDWFNLGKDLVGRGFCGFTRFQTEMPIEIIEPIFLKHLVVTSEIRHIAAISLPRQIAHGGNMW